MHKKKAITTQEFDEKFESGESIAEHVDLENMVKRVNLDLPVWAIRAIDHEADRRGMPRQSLIKNWIIDRIDMLVEQERKVM